MASEPESTRSRRALLATAAGGVAIAVADSLTRVQPVAGSHLGSVVLGHGNLADGITSITIPNAIGVAFRGIATTSSDGVEGNSVSGGGVVGISGSGTGTHGASTTATGVHGVSGSSYGVQGDNQSSTVPAVVGWSQGHQGLQNTGVMGYSGFTGIPSSPTKTGVYGYAVQDATSRGVTGESTVGRGVNGIATSGTGVYGTGSAGEGVRGVSSGSNGTAGTTASGIASGVYGENTGGGFGTYGRSNAGGGAVGVFGESTSGTGVKANSSAGTAFEAQGRVKFSTAGLAAVAVNGKSKVVNPGISLSTTSMVLCTLETNQGGLSVQRVTKNTVAGTFTVFLSKAVAVGKTAKIAWFVIG